MGSVVSYLTPALSARPAHRSRHGRSCYVNDIALFFFAACSLPEPGRGTAPTPGAACHDNDHWRSRRPRDRWLGRERRRGFVHADSASREHTHPCVFFKKKRTHSLIHASVRKHKTISHSYKNAHILKFTVVYTRTRPISHYNDKKNVHIL